MKRLFFIWALLISLNTHATNYYFSASGAGSGCTIGSPCPLSQVPSHGAPGDSLLFHKGDIFSGTINYTNSGSSGSPIVFDVYGNAVNNAAMDGNATSASPVLTFNSISFVKVNNLAMQNSTNATALFYIVSCHDISVNNCHFTSGVRGIAAHLCTNNISLTYNYFDNISDPNLTTNGGGNAIQVSNCTGSGIVVDHNNSYEVVTPGTSSTPGVGDIFSFFQDNGTSGSPIHVYYNNVRGGGSNTGGFAGIVLGDLGGSYQDAEYNTLINSGGVGAQIQGGTNITMSNNTIYSAQFPYTGVGMAFGNYSGAAVSNITMGGNKINFTVSSGAVYNKWWDPATKTYPAFQPTNWLTNTADNTADAGAYDALLPNPLWTGSPWNTATVLIAAKGRKAVQL